MHGYFTKVQREQALAILRPIHEKRLCMTMASDFIRSCTAVLYQYESSFMDEFLAANIATELDKVKKNWLQHYSNYTLLIPSLSECDIVVNYTARETYVTWQLNEALDHLCSGKVPTSFWMPDTKELREEWSKHLIRHPENALSGNIKHLFGDVYVVKNQTAFKRLVKSVCKRIGMGAPAMENYPTEYPSAVSVYITEESMYCKVRHIPIENLRQKLDGI